MTFKLPMTLALATFVVLGAGCQPQAGPPPPPPSAPQAPAEPAPAPAPAAKADAYEAFVPQGPALDQRAFAGLFTGTLPCADCPGIDTSLALTDQYRFELNETYRGKAGAAPAKIKGTWSAEDDGHLLRLDPDSKSEADRLYQVIANDEIRVADPDGKPITDSQDHPLLRAPANN